MMRIGKRLLGLLGMFSILALCMGCGLAGQKYLRTKEQAVQKLAFSPVGKASAKLAVNRGYRFIAFGDWGTGTPFQKDIAEQLAQLEQKAPFDSVLLLGDNFYPTGNVERLGKPYFTDMYPTLLQRHVQFIVTMGNHDTLMGHQAEQIAFFKVPGYYYEVHKPEIDFFVLNTNSFARDNVQQQWLKRALGASKAPWKIVMGHHPIYSSGEHGFNQGLHETLEPLLVKHKVDLYLAGHDHDYERFKPIQGVQYIVSGGGGAYLRNFKTPLMSQSLVHLKAHHFLDFELKGNTLQLQVIDKTGQVIDSTQWTKQQVGRLEA
jgi:hypothetical protein